MLPAAFEAGNYGSRPAERQPGAVLEPVAPYAVHGGWRAGRRGEMARSFLATAKGLARGVLGRLTRRGPPCGPRSALTEGGDGPFIGTHAGNLSGFVDVKHA